ncbi:hypothetical protein JKP88DRAFT_351915 [Tribonema minus]|uniref:Uncharacterized protein n=1 Tax=Tribonema minus TaxID=303371 RepID=A0A836CP07_9STRA|nr:hypothetical protein JKP88DRAFT_351915 [Tribonema minus]
MPARDSAAGGLRGSSVVLISSAEREVEVDSDEAGFEPDGFMDYGPGCNEHECLLSYEEDTSTGQLLLKAGQDAAAVTLESLEPFNPVQINEVTGKVSLDGQKLLNLGVLLCAALWIAHTVITVDHAIWRGWTWQEIAMRLPYDNWGGYVGALDEHPILTKTTINVVIYLVGDWLAQVEFGRRDILDFDLGRTLRNGLIGGMFGPLVHYYYQWSDVILPMDVPINRPLKILMDQSIYFVSKCSAYMFLVGLLRGDSFGEVREQWQARIKTVVLTGWKFWPLVHVFTYSVIPAQHRVLWVNCVDLVWSSILSGLASGNQGESPEEVEEGAGDTEASADS